MSLTLAEYQQKATETAIYPEIGKYPIGPMYAVIGLCGEAGEVADQVKKSWRNEQLMSKARKANIEDEAGDVLWYLAQLATELDLSLEEIAVANLNKLASRLKKKEIQNHP